MIKFSREKQEENKSFLSSNGQELTSFYFYSSSFRQKRLLRQEARDKIESSDNTIRIVGIVVVQVAIVVDITEIIRRIHGTKNTAPTAKLQVSPYSLPIVLLSFAY